jgi:tetratricopeptide (TPR) repeat protein
LKQSLALFQTLHHVAGQGWALSRLGTVALYMGDPQRAVAWLAELAELMRAAENTMYLSYALRYWGFALLQQGDVAQALAKFQEELALIEEPEEIPAGSWERWLRRRLPWDIRDEQRVYWALSTRDSRFNTMSCCPTSSTFTSAISPSSPPSWARQFSRQAGPRGAR